MEAKRDGNSSATDLKDTLNALPGAVYAFRPGSGFPFYLNQRCLDMLEADSREDAFTGCEGSFWEYVAPEDRERVQRSYRRLAQNLGSCESFDAALITRKNHRHLVHVVAQSCRDSGGNPIIVDFTMDLVAAPDQETKPGIDPMTGLLEMHAFFSALAASQKSHPDAVTTVLFLDLVNFRMLNLRYGISYGDGFLKAIARCIRRWFPEGAAAHFGGDHFAIYTPSRQARAQAERLRDMIRKMAPGSTVDCTIGIFEWIDRDLGPETACTRAKIACDDCRKHVNTFFLDYTDEMGKDLELAEYVTSSLDEAIRKGWIRVYYQPIIRTLSGELCGMEALARWDDPVRGLLPPAAFIEPLEKAQLVWRLDICVIRQVVERIAARSEKNEPEIPVSINLSRVDFLCCDIFQEIENLVKSFDIPRRMLHIEVTESILISREDVIFEALDRFRDAGYEVWMDDFGSGYSTLNLLKDCSFDVLKMDMAFLKEDTPRSRSIIASVVAMNQKIGGRTLAEGVETKEQADFLMHSGCGMMQGYYFGKPLPFEETLERLGERGVAIESAGHKAYYGAAERINFLTDTPLVLVEEHAGTLRALALNDAAIKKAEEDGYADLTAIEEDINGRRKEESARYADAARYAAATGMEGELLLPIHGSERVLRYRFIGSLPERNLFAVRIYNYAGSREKLVRKARTLLNVLKFYEYAYAIDTKKKTLRSLSFSDDFEGEAGEAQILATDGVFSDLLPKIFPADRERYAAFLDPDTLAKRLPAAPRGTLSGAFRTMEEDGRYVWMAHRMHFAADTGRSEILYLIRRMDIDTAMREKAQCGEDPYQSLTSGKANEADVLWNNLLLHIPLPLFWKDKNRRFLGASKSFLDYYGFADESAILGKTDEDMNWHPSNELYRNVEEQVISSGEMQVLVPGRCIAKGTTHAIRATKWPTYRNGRISGLMGFFLDERALEHSLQLHPAGRDTDGLLTAAEFVQDLSDYESENIEGERPFGLIVLQIPELARIGAHFGKTVRSRVLSACKSVIAKEAGSSATAAQLGAGQFGILAAAPAKGEIIALSEKLSRGIEAIHRVDGIPCTLFARTWVAYGDEAMQVRRTVLSAFFEEQGKDGAVIPKTEGPRLNLERFLDEIPFGCYILRPDQQILYWNREAERLLGYSQEEVIGKRCVDQPFGCSFVSGETILGPSCPALVAYTSGQVQTMQMFIRKKDGDNLLIRNTLVPLRDESGKITELVSLFVTLGDVAYDDSLVRDIYEVATRDPLTCLPGRRYMEACIGEELERYERTGHPFAVLFADVDRFHDINNRYGHTVGDQLLKELGLGLRKFGRHADRFARWGGDEFVGLLQLKRPEEIEQAAERFLALSNRTEIENEGQRISCQAAIGITVVHPGDDVKSIVSRADRYMYLAKARDADQIVTDYTVPEDR
ncbi:MAG: EAL domain-containing protein [Lachnospiraceae bacterium]|jgi:diguanylate cyclase (GGDEF)-like protein|nr:EAL domain-containing protein [Lachnospiraceae bacterium]MCI1398535.1 EAL domain-containing protein [Lachnospiraceae bacterium]MCI1424687.1 EAL domain-containing protein [Lachnospiraceae bacterium]MCI1453428.1 EAL domain-containing protein [Lachnospiraceae bacterium]